MGAPPLETVRVFVGAMLDLGATRRVLDLARATRQRAEAAGWRVRWVPAPSLHVTLRFVGDIDAGLAGGVAAGSSTLQTLTTPPERGRSRSPTSP